MIRQVCLAMLLTGLTTLGSCASREPATGRIDQEADGCGAFRYKGTSNLDCRYQGRLVITGTNPVGTCLNDSQVSCSFDVQCEWRVSEAITACVSGYDCMSQLPPEGSITNPPGIPFDLPPGSTLCDPPAAAAALSGFCNTKWNIGYDQVRDHCTGQTDRNMGGAECCLDCKTPTPLPGGTLVAGEAAADGAEYGAATYGEPACSGEDN